MSKTEEKSFWVVFALIGIILAPLILIAGIIIGINVDRGISLSSDTMSSWISAIATVAIAVLTFILAKETWNLRLSQINQINEIKKEAIRPSLEFYLLSSPVSFHLMNVHIENNGKGVARNIKFTFSGEGNAPFTESEQAVVDDLLKFNILKNGMLALGSGKQRTSYIFSFLELSEKMAEGVFDMRINISMTYEDAEGRLYKSDSFVDFSEFKGVIEVGGGSPIYNLYQEAKKIREIFQNAQSGLSTKRINVNSYSGQDRKNEQEALQNRMEEMRKNKP